MDHLNTELMKAIDEAVTAVKVKELVLKVTKVNVPTHLGMCSNVARRAITAAVTLESREAVTVAVMTTFMYKDCLERFMSTIPAAPMSGQLADDHKLDTPGNGGDGSAS